MKELIRTNDAVLLSYLEVVLGDANIEFDVFDRNMSIMDGSIGALPRRILVADHQYDMAKELLAAITRNNTTPGA